MDIEAGLEGPNDVSEDQLKLILQKLEILRNYLIVADEGARQQQSAMLDEINAVMKDIKTEVNHWIKQHK